MTLASLLSIFCSPARHASPFLLPFAHIRTALGQDLQYRLDTRSVGISPFASGPNQSLSLSLSLTSEGDGRTMLWYAPLEELYRDPRDVSPLWLRSMKLPSGLHYEMLFHSAVHHAAP